MKLKNNKTKITKVLYQPWGSWSEGFTIEGCTIDDIRSIMIKKNIPYFVCETDGYEGYHLCAGMTILFRQKNGKVAAEILEVGMILV